MTGPTGLTADAPQVFNVILLGDYGKPKVSGRSRSFASDSDFQGGTDLAHAIVAEPAQPLDQDTE